MNSLLVFFASLSACCEALSWNDTDQLAILNVQLVNQSALSSTLEQMITSSWTFLQVPNLFVQQQGAAPVNDTQFPNFGALLPWSQILAMLGSPTRKLIFFVRHCQAWENVAPDNTQCEFSYDGQVRQNFDSGLSDLGVTQCQSLNALMKSPSSQGSDTWWKTLRLDQAPFFSSPLSRTIQTTNVSFSGLITTPVKTSELLRANLGYDVCNARYPLSVPTPQTTLPAPFNTGCNVPAASLETLYGNLPVKFEFSLRPAGGVFNNLGTQGYGLISDADTLWRADEEEEDTQKSARGVAFLAQLFAVSKEPIVGVVTHSEMVRIMSVATGGVPISTAYGEVIPLMIDLIQGSDAEQEW